MIQENKPDSDWARGQKRFVKAMQHMTVENFERNRRAYAERFNEMTSKRKVNHDRNC